MTKLLNLDDLATVDRAVTIKGVRYAMVDLSVGDFIKNSREFKHVTPASPADQQFEVMVAMVCRSFPTMTAEVASGLTFPQVKALSDFINADPEEEAKKAIAAEGGAKN